MNNTDIPNGKPFHQTTCITGLRNDSSNGYELIGH